MNSYSIKTEEFFGGGETVHRKYCQFFKSFGEDW